MAAPSRPGSASAKRDDRQRRVRRADAEAGDAERHEPAPQRHGREQAGGQTGQAHHQRRVRPAAPARTRPNDRCSRAWTHDPTVHVSDDAASTIPANSVEVPFTDVRAREMKASAEKKANVSTPRVSTAAGRPRAARSVPGRGEGPEGGDHQDRPQRHHPAQEPRRPGGQAGQHQARTHRQAQGQADRCRPVVVGLPACPTPRSARTARSTHRPGDGDQAQEHPPPPDRGGHRRRGQRRDQRRHDPRRGHDGEHLGSQRRREAPARRTRRPPRGPRRRRRPAGTGPAPAPPSTGPGRPRPGPR